MIGSACKVMNTKRILVQSTPTKYGVRSTSTFIRSTGTPFCTPYTVCTLVFVIALSIIHASLNLRSDRLVSIQNAHHFVIIYRKTNVTRQPYEYGVQITDQDGE